MLSIKIHKTENTKNAMAKEKSFAIALGHGGIGEVWLTHRFVGPARVGSNPTYRPDLAR